MGSANVTPYAVWYDHNSIWIERSTPVSLSSVNWSLITMLSHGTKLAAVAEEGYIHTSTDGGVTWFERIAPGSRLWSSVAISAMDRGFTLLLNFPTMLIQSLNNVLKRLVGGAYQLELGFPFRPFLFHEG